MKIENSKGDDLSYLTILNKVFASGGSYSTLIGVNNGNYDEMSTVIKYSNIKSYYAVEGKGQ